MLLPLYQWQTSFDPLTRKYEQAKGKGLNRPEFRKLKCISKQITDEEKIIKERMYCANFKIKERMYCANFKISWLQMLVVFKVRSTLRTHVFSLTYV